MSVDTGIPSSTGDQNHGRRENRTNSFQASPGNLNNAGNNPRFDFTQRLRLPLSSKNGSKVINDFMKNFKEQDRDESTWKVGVAILDNNQEVGWRYSTIAIIVQAVADPSRIAAYPMQIEHTISRPLEPVVTKTQDQLELRVPSVPSMAMDLDWERAVIDRVREAFPNVDPENIFLQAGMTVPATMDLSDAMVVEDLTQNALLACVTLMSQNIPGFPDVDVSALVDGVQPVVRIEPRTFSDRRDLVGNPIREDFRWTFSAKLREDERSESKRDPFRQNDIGASETAWGDASMFFDTVYAPQNRNTLLTAASAADRNRVLIMRAVITDMHQYNLASTASNILMLLPVIALIDPAVRYSLIYQRMRDYYNKFPDAEINPTDVGMTNLITRVNQINANDAPEPAVLMNSENDPTDFVRYMSEAYQDDLYVAIDVPSAGPKSWFLGLFSGIASGDIASMHEFCRGADRVTGGLFTQMYFPDGLANMKVSDFIIDPNNTLYGGYFNQRQPDGSVVQVDERVVDYISVLNKSGRLNPEIMKKWSQSWMREFDPVMRLANRDEIIQSYAGNVTHTDTIERHTFNPQMLTALWQAAQQAGLAPEGRFPNTIGGAQSGLGAPTWASFGGLNMTNVDSSGFQRHNGGLGRAARSTTFGVSRGSTGRWGSR